VILGKNGHGGHKKGTIFKGALPFNMISQLFWSLPKFVYVGVICKKLELKIVGFDSRNMQFSTGNWN